MRSVLLFLLLFLFNALKHLYRGRCSCCQGDSSLRVPRLGVAMGGCGCLCAFWDPLACANAHTETFSHICVTLHYFVLLIWLSNRTWL